MAGLLRRVASGLTSPAFWLGVGFLFFITLIWIIGPLVMIGETRPLASFDARLWTTVAVAAIILLRVLWRGASNPNFIKRFGESLQPSQQESEAVKLLHLRFQQTLKILRRAQFGTGRHGLLGRFAKRHCLYELPWYLVMGASGSGKTTVLRNSGLDFSLTRSLNNDLSKEAGGTKNCDWRISQQAVLIDTAGRYATHDSHAESDHAEWRGLIALLRKRRRLQPINGVLLMLSVTQLLDSTAQARRRQIEVLRHRLNELREDLAVQVPVYLLINQCDLLCGFEEYFASLDRAGREQVWGFTLPWQSNGAADDSAATLGRELTLLQQRLHNGLVDTLLGEPALARRARIHSFTQNFALLCEILQEVGVQLFADAHFSAAPLLRGIYFTSAAQDGMPIDRVVGAQKIGPAAHAPQRPRGTAKSYFLAELLSKVVFAEAHLSVGRNRRMRGRSYLLQLGSYVTCALLLATVGVVWLKSYHNNQSYLIEVEANVDRLTSKLQALPMTIQSNIYPLLAALTDAQTASNSVHFLATEPLLPWTFGLYQGDKLRAGSQPLYESLLRGRLAPSIEARLESLLQTVAAEDLEFSYEVLKTYLMLHDPAHFNGDAVKAFILADWDYNMPSGAADQERDALAHHVDALIGMGAMVATKPINTALVAATRARLTQFSLPQRTYRRILRVLEHNNLPDFFVNAAVGPGRTAIFRHSNGKPLTDGINALYTYRGYHELFAPQVDEVVRYINRDDVWVLGKSSASAYGQAQAIANGDLAMEVKRLYMLDYVTTWERLLADIDLVTPDSLPQVTELAREMSTANSPLVRLLRAVAHETTLLDTVPADDTVDASLLERGKRAIQATQDNVAHIISPSVLPELIRPAEKPERIVDQRFEALHRLADSEGGAGNNNADGSPLADIERDILALHLLLSSVDAALADGHSPSVGDLPVRLKAQASRLPSPAKRVLETLASTSESMIARQVRTAKNARMTGTVTRVCQETIAGRYPFKANAKREVTHEDFARMFAPGGIADNYFQHELAALVDTSASPWRLLAGAQGALEDYGVARQFERAAVIKDVFFRSGDGPTITAMIKPIEMDAAIIRMQLDIDGQMVNYQHGPLVGHTVHWPGPRGSRQVRLSLESAPDGATQALSWEGTWALHRLFDQARIVPGNSPEQFQAILKLGGHEVRFEVVTDSVKNAFALKEMREFACPARL